MHELRYGTSAPDERAEIVSLRSTVDRRPAQAAAGKGQARRTRARQDRIHRQARRSISMVQFRPTPTYARAALAAGNRISGPALIEEHASTTVLLPGDRLEVDAYGNLVIKVAGGR